MELVWNLLDNAPSSIVFYLEMKVEVGVHYIRSRFTPRVLGWVEKTEIVFFEINRSLWTRKYFIIELVIKS